MKSRRVTLHRFLVLMLGSALLSAIPARVGLAQQQEDPLLKAMSDELARSVAELKLDSLEKPYYIEYAVTDSESFDVEATFGAVVRSYRSRSRPVSIDLRVGSYGFDNSEFVSTRSLFSSDMFPRPLVQEDDYAALRHDLWLATDATYKKALEQLAKKRAFVQNKVQGEQVPDFSRAEPVKSVAARKPASYDQAKWQEAVRRLSALFREFPAIQESRVNLRVRSVNKYFTNSEGSVCRQPAPLAMLYARASTQAADGMRLKNFVAFFATSPEQMSSESEIAAAIRQMAQELAALASAPVLDKYVGPVLVTGQAAGEMFAQVLAPQLSGHRPPLVDPPQMAEMLPKSEFADRLNRRVLPDFLTVVDDPTQTSFNGRPLIGSYQVDDQGVPARPVTLIEQGVLKTLLMSRRPRKEIPESNGHGRSMQYGSASAQAGNLFIKTTGGKAFAELKQELINLSKAQGLTHGLMIKMLDNPGISGREFSSLFSPRPREQAPAPLLVYKVSVEDGSEQLVRGLTESHFTPRILKDIVAASSDYHVNNRLMSGGGGLSGMIFGFGSGDVGGEGIPVTIIAPSVLFEEVELKGATGPQKKPALLPHPFFAR